MGIFGEQREISMDRQYRTRDGRETLCKRPEDR